jgi:hypothetical protein
MIELYSVVSGPSLSAIVLPVMVQFDPHDAELLLNVLLLSIKLDATPWKNNAPPPVVQSLLHSVLFSENVEFVIDSKLFSPKIPIAPASTVPVEPVTLLLLNVHLFISIFPLVPENSKTPDSTVPLPAAKLLLKVVSFMIMSLISLTIKMAPPCTGLPVTPFESNTHLLISIATSRSLESRRQNLAKCRYRSRVST